METKVSGRLRARTLAGGAEGVLPGAEGHEEPWAPALQLGGGRVSWDGPEERDEAISLQQHAQEGPPHEDDEDPREEEAGALHLWPLEEEGEGSPEADDEDQAGEEEDLGRGRGAGQRSSAHVDLSHRCLLRGAWPPCTHVPEGQEHRVEVQEHPKEDEEEAKAHQSHADPCGGWEEG